MTLHDYRVMQTVLMELLTFHFKRSSQTTIVADVLLMSVGKYLLTYHKLLILNVTLKVEGFKKLLIDSPII